MATTAIAQSAVAQFGAVEDLSDLRGIAHVRGEGSAEWGQLGGKVSGVGDVNGDGHEDLAVCGPDFSGGDFSYGGMCVVLFGGPSFGLTSPIDLGAQDGSEGFSIEGQGLAHLLGTGLAPLGDFNADGYDDFAIGVPGEDRAYVLFGSPTIGSTGEIDLSTLDGTTGFVLQGAAGEYAGGSIAGPGDLDQDGHPDLVVGAERAGAPFLSMQLADATSWVDAGDLDQDGDVDLVLTHESFAPPITTLENDGTGFFPSGRSFDLDWEPTQVELCDLSGDGLDDVVVACVGGTFPRLEGQVAVWINTGDGDLSAAPARHTIGQEDVRFATGDVDGDGDVDLVAVAAKERSGGPEDSRCTILVNDGSGTFTVDNVIPLPGFLRDVSVGDMDGDGIKDIAVVGTLFHSGPPARVWTFLSKPSGPGPGIGTSASPHSPSLILYLNYANTIVVTDLDQDGHGDLLLGPNTQVFLNDGAGGFQAGAEYDYDLGDTVTDLDGDGLDDVVAMQESPEELKVALGDGVGGLEVPASYSFPQDLGHSTAADIDGDGDDDLVLYAEHGGTLTVLENLGDGTFEGESRGSVYVVFGGPGVGASGEIDLAALDGSDGFVLKGPNGNAELGASAAPGGDVNADGVPDLVVGATGSQVGRPEGGAAVVLFGAPGLGSSGVIEASELNGNDGFLAYGALDGDHAGFSVAGGADVNGDGIDDFLAGAPFRPTPGAEDEDRGMVYLVYGAAGIGLGGTLDLGTLDGTNGMRFPGPEPDTELGRTLAEPRDFDGDGAADLLLGAWGAGPDWEGWVFLVYGGAGLGTSPDFDLSTLDGTLGTRFVGGAEDDFAGQGLAITDDLNDDGARELVIGIPGAAPIGVERAGEAVVLFGDSGD